MIENKIR